MIYGYYYLLISKESLVIYLKINVSSLIEGCEQTLQNINTILVQFSKLQYLLRHVCFLIATTRNPLCEMLLNLIFDIYRKSVETNQVPL